MYGQVSNWADVTAEFPQESIRHSLLFLIYINDLLKLIADGTSLYSVTHDISTSANEVNNDLAKINNWAFQWKMNLNQDSSKQAQEVIFSCKSKKKKSHLPLFFSHTQVSQSSSQKHLGIFDG